MEENCTDAKFNVAFSDGSKYHFCMKGSEKISDLEEKIKKEIPNKVQTECDIKFMYIGKILNKNEYFSVLNISDSSTIQCFFQKKDDSVSNYQEPRGFDRLIRMNYTNEQIQAIRQSFHQVHNTNLQADDTIEIEEEWFPLIFINDRGNRADENPRTTNTRNQVILILLVSICLGFSLGNFSIFLIILSTFTGHINLSTGLTIGFLLRTGLKMILKKEY